jgi:hypothetical protein
MVIAGTVIGRIIVDIFFCITLPSCEKEKDGKGKPKTMIVYDPKSKTIYNKT